MTMQCAYGDVDLYLLAAVELVIDGAKFQVQTAIPETLPVSALLGTDVPEMGKILQNKPGKKWCHWDALVMTRAQKKELVKNAEEEKTKEIDSGGKPNLIVEPMVIKSKGKGKENSGIIDNVGGEIEEFSDLLVDHLERISL